MKELSVGKILTALECLRISQFRHQPYWRKRSSGYPVLEKRKKSENFSNRLRYTEPNRRWKVFHIGFRCRRAVPDSLFCEQKRRLSERCEWERLHCICVRWRRRGYNCSNVLVGITRHIVSVSASRRRFQHMQHGASAWYIRIVILWDLRYCYNALLGSLIRIMLSR